MCILFVAVNPKPASTGYKLVLASNRDEFFDRPTLPAHSWEKEPHIFGGMDMEPGREGGTWLGMNASTGKVASLLNITCKENYPDKRGRGRLVPGFLNRDDDDDGVPYCNELHQHSGEYNPFNLVTVSNLKTSPSVTYYSNTSSQGAVKLPINEDGTVTTYGIGNSLYPAAYVKVKDGTSAFESLVRTATSDQQSDLVDGLLAILKDPHRHYPDPQLQIQASNFADEFMKGLSARYVHIPRAKYGTRTHTIILVRADNHVDFLEWTMEQPIINSNKPNWKHSNLSTSL